MRTKEELLKIYGAYAPYKLHILHIEKNMRLIISGCYFHENMDENIQLKLLNWDSKVNSDEAKPILYSMGMIINEVESHGNKFIPIIEILKKTSLLDLSDCKFDVYQDEEKFTQVVYVNAEDENGRVIDSMYYDSNIFWHMNNGGGYNPTNPQSEPQEMLLKFHFNVFGLDDSEYVKK